MRAIIIQDNDAVALLDKLKLTSLEAGNYGLSRVYLDRNAWDVSPEIQKSIVETAHKTFHMVVCRWLQEMGCDVTR